MKKMKELGLESCIQASIHEFQSSIHVLPSKPRNLGKGLKFGFYRFPLLYASFAHAKAKHRAR
jgi:hypothetical protein